MYLALATYSFTVNLLDCRPTYSERLLFDYMVHHRKTVIIREATVELFGQADVQLFGNDKNFVSVLKVRTHVLYIANPSNIKITTFL